MNAHVNTEDLIKLLNENHEKVIAQAVENEQKIAREVGELKSQMTDVEQKMARRAKHGRGDQPVTVGQAVIESETFKAFIAGGASGKVKIETKAINTITSGATFAGGMISPDVRTEVIGMPQRKLVRDLVAPGATISNLVEYPRQTGRQNSAAVVAEGALKPQSDANFELGQAPVRTIAHWMRASRQALDDAPQLMSLIDGELRYGLNLVEEAEMLFGDGSGQHLLGIVPSATAFAAPFVITDATALDVLLQGIAQVEAALYPADAIVVNPIDWRRMQAIKDAVGRHLAGGPFVSQVPVAWNLPIVTSLSIPAGNFLVGAFAYGAQIFDRMTTEVLISTEDQDNFVKNLITVRGEERLAFAVKRPAAFVYGSLG